ncbi:hypothetical protein [Pyxidicoccus caerfyrddinensis]|uniref:hypothetical protein n=1 Tax=Pyxidicoccus caerfyrddinensis TaxID=2709663 RepID=UPI0013DBFB33|nr:hypothetical protein [Pyxidicoccus caerfyrddinensis]
MASPTSPNFQFLAAHDPLLVALGAQAERFFADDSVTCLMKLRQLGEVLAEHAASSMGIDMPGLNLRDVRRLPVPLAPLAEQEEIGKRLASLMEVEQRLRNAWSAANKHAAQLDGALLAKAFCGDLVPQDPNDEPASVLLERIRAEREAAASTPKQRRTTKATGRKSTTGNPT